MVEEQAMVQTLAEEITTQQEHLPDSPLKLVVYKVVNGAQYKHWECECGANESRNFGKYLKTLVDIDERKRKHYSKEMHIRCNNCGNSYNLEKLYNHYQDYSKNPHVPVAVQQEAAKLLANNVGLVGGEEQQIN